jgi:hypothetical protein
MLCMAACIADQMSYNMLHLRGKASHQNRLLSSYTRGEQSMAMVACYIRAALDRGQAVLLTPVDWDTLQRRDAQWLPTLLPLVQRINLLLFQQISAVTHSLGMPAAYVQQCMASSPLIRQSPLLRMSAQSLLSTVAKSVAPAFQNASKHLIWSSYDKVITLLHKCPLPQ